MAKKKKITAEDLRLANSIEAVRVDFAAVKSLEDRAKVGFFCECKNDTNYLERQFRLCCESKDGESEPSVLTPWCTANTLQTMIDGCLFLHPLIIATIKDRQSNAPKPEE